MSRRHDQTLFSNNNNCFNVTKNYGTFSDEESRILSWISPLESWMRHSDVARARAQGVGEWVLKSSEFQAWRWSEKGQSIGRILFGGGAPGVGKTFICSLVIDTLCDEAAGRNVAVGCLYCDYRGQKEQTPEVMIGSLLRQFVTALPEIPEAIKRTFRVAKAHLGGRAPKLAKIVELFPPVLECFQEVFICVDALDEFVLEYRAGFLRSLHNILGESANTKLFFTARPHIQSTLSSNIPLDMSIITIQPLFSDVEMYLATKFDTDPHHGAMDDGLRSEILTKILKQSPEIFLLVALQVDSILGEITIGGRRKKVQEMTNDLGDSYTTTLERIRDQPGALAGLGISALMWISLAERPLLIDELCYALAVEAGSRSINIEMVPPIETIVASCMGLVTIDHASSTVRLVHATLEEYLRSHQENVFRNPHATISEVCLSYLDIQSVRDLPPDLEAAPPAFPFLNYASCYWGAHARKEPTSSIRHLALDILGQYPQHVAANIFLSNGGAPWYGGASSKGFTGLHYVAYFGIDELLKAQLSVGSVNLNQSDGWGRTPLILAVETGNDGVVRALLDCPDVDPNSLDRYKQTPLYLACQRGNEEVARDLLSYPDTDPEIPGLGGQTPLSQASAYGYEGIVRALLSHGRVNPNSLDMLNQTPLHKASEFGHEGVVRALLSHANINPNSLDEENFTPLHQASENGHEGVVRALLSHTDINPNSSGEENLTPLHQASANGHEGVTRILLSRTDIDPNLADILGRTPLWLASTLGHEGVVRALLNRADVNPDLADVLGDTPLRSAIHFQHHAIVGLLRVRQ